LKGADKLVDAIVELNRNAGGNWYAALAGEGYLEQPLREQAAASGFGDHFRFLGPLKAPAIASWMNASDLFCLPSQSEGCPNVVIEALNCGCPVVATRVGGIPELVDPDCSMLFDQQTAEVLASTLRKAADRTWDRAKIASWQSRSWADVASETFTLCHQAVEKARIEQS
jgi:glycosyltransferase involved in cell wall biosynthesis